MNIFTGQHDGNTFNPWLLALVMMLAGFLFLTVSLLLKETELSAKAIESSAIIVGSFVLLAAGWLATLHVLKLLANEQDEIDTLLERSREVLSQSGPAQKHFLEKADKSQE